MMDFDGRAREIVVTLDERRFYGFVFEDEAVIAAALKAAYNEGIEAALKEAQPWFKPEAGNHPDIMIRAKKVPT